MAQRMQEPPEVAGLPVGSLEDKELTLAFQAGDKGAYQAIHDRYETRVHNVCRRMLGNPHDAQEAAQESFLRVYQALGRFNGRYQLGAWITRIATNVCLDHIRSRSRRPVDAVELDVLELDRDRHNGEDDPQDITIRRAESRRVRKILAQLPPLHRAAIVLRDFEGLSYAEVAVALEMTECQVKALIHRARQNFKRSWAPLSILLPWRLVNRFKEVDHVSKDQVAQAAVTTAQVAPSCTSMLQQCSQYMGQHVAAAVTAAIVGTAAGAASHAATKPSKPEVVRDGSVVTADGELGLSSSRSILKKVDDGSGDSPASRRRSDSPSVTAAGGTQPVPAASPTSAASPAPADPSPSPAASPSEAPPAPPTNAGGPTPSSSPSPKSSPARTGPFAPSVGFDWGRAIPTRIPKSHTFSFDCHTNQFQQRLETVVDDDDSAVTYPALVQLRWGAAQSSGRFVLELTVWKNGREVYYSGTGDVSGDARSGSERKLSFVGNYGTLNEHAQDMDLPANGRFTVGLTLDCAAPSVISESVVLGT